MVRGSRHPAFYVCAISRRVVCSAPMSTPKITLQRKPEPQPIVVYTPEPPDTLSPLEVLQKFLAEDKASSA